MTGNFKRTLVEANPNTRPAAPDLATETDTAQAADAQPARGPHDEILEGLLEYTRFPHGQGFAVVLNGPWGSGKTRFIKDNLDHFARERPGEVKQGALYISLYGISEVSQIEDRLFQQLHPILSHKFTQFAGAFLRGAAKAAIKVDLGQGFSATGSVPDVDLSSVLKNAEGRVVIFDDFERALMSPVAILGYLNPLVEHEDCKVIILADETQISGENRTEYEARKEKTVGRTFEFRPDFARVYCLFLNEIDEPSARKFLGESREAVGRVFADSKFDNLRLLKQFMWDFERVWKVLAPDQRENRVAMAELLELLCASSLELRHGMPVEDFQLINPSSLILRHTRKEKGIESSPIEKLHDKYPSVRFDSSLVEAYTIIDVVLRSKVSSADIPAQLQRHPYFLKPRDTAVPSWRALWLGHELPIADQDAVVARFEADFEARSFHDIGVVLHIFGLGLWLSKLGFTGWEAERLEDKLKRYVDAIYASREPTLSEAADERPFETWTGSHGLGFREAGDPLFAKLVEYEREQRATWRKRGYPEIADYLRGLIAQDSETFLRLVCFSAGGPATFAKIGVLKLIPAEDFARAVASLPYHDQSKVMIALSIRYEQKGGYEELGDEILWLREVQKSIAIEAGKLPRIGREALLGLNQVYVGKVTGDADFVSARESPATVK